MYVSKDLLLEAMKKNDQRYFNYFKTFGFLVVKDFLSKEDFKRYKKEYEYEYRRRGDGPSWFEMLQNRLGPKKNRVYGFRSVIKKIISSKVGMNFLPAFLEESNVLMNLLKSKELNTIFTYLCGKDWLYLGSDGSRFNTTSFPWHRDWYTKSPQLKCNIYLNKNSFFGGNFQLIPGSNRPYDQYAKNIQRSISWPMQNKFPSGMNENNFLPEIVNPRRKLSLFSFLKKNKREFDVPYIKVNIKPCDIVLFDQRLLHCVESNFPKNIRQLLTILVAPNPLIDDSLDYPSSCSKELITDELLDLVINERNHIGIDPWGSELLKSDFVDSKHYINITKTDDSDCWNMAKIKFGDNVYSHVLDFSKYDAVGKSYRSLIGKSIKDSSDKLANEFSYGDVHLGINSVNIVETHDS